MTVKEYVDLYLEIYDKLKLVNFNKEQVAMCILQEISKNKRGNEIEKNKLTYNSVLPATSKQLEYLKQLRIEVNLPLTKKGASDMIEKTKAEKIYKETRISNKIYYSSGSTQVIGSLSGNSWGC